MISFCASKLRKVCCVLFLMVNTFLLCKNFVESAKLLDSRRLNKQCTEAKQIIEAIERMHSKSVDKSGFTKHPALLQWKDYVDALKYYYNVHREEALEREIKISAPAYTFACPVEEIKIPWFVDCPHFWYSHCAALYLKMKWHYKYVKLVFPRIYLKYGYFWPSKIKIENLCPLFVKRQLMHDAISMRVPIMDLDDFLEKYCGNGRKEAARCTASYKSGALKGINCDNAVKISKGTSVYCGIHSRKKRNK